MEQAEIDEVWEAHTTEIKKGEKQPLFTQTQYKVVGFIAAVFAYLIYAEKMFTPQNGWLYFLFLLIVYYAVTRQKDLPRPLTESELKIILYKIIQTKQKKDTGEFHPNGVINILLQCKLQNIEEHPWKWWIPFEIKKPNGGIDCYVAQMHPYTGEIMAFVEFPEGFTGKEVFDLKYIPTKWQLWEKTYGKPTAPGGKIAR